MSRGGRLVNLASSGHRFSNVDLDDPNFEKTPYDPWQAYGRAKTANVLFAVEFDRRHKANGIRATAVHPGGIATELGRHAFTEPDALQKFLDDINAKHAAAGHPPFKLKTVPQGAATSVWAGVVASADEVGGRYCEDCHVATLLAAGDVSPISAGVRAYALDPEAAKKLWAQEREDGRREVLSTKRSVSVEQARHQFFARRAADRFADQRGDRDDSDIAGMRAPPRLAGSNR